jgi:lipid-binding SYLF domain-containing protein
MTRTILIIVCCALSAAGALGQKSVGGWDPDQLKNAEKTVANFKETDKSVAKFFESARGYAVFSTVGKGAIGIGGAHGSGIVFEQGEPVGETSLTQITIGFQWGGQAYSEIVFFEDKDAIDRFKEGNFELAAQASAVAVTVGASADLAYNNGVAIVTMVKGGLMYEASVGGQKFSYDPFAEKDEEERD